MPSDWTCDNAGMDKTLLKGLAVLEAVTDVAQPPQTIDELAARLSLTRSNAHRSLQTLMHAGYVSRNEAGGYRAGVRLFELAARQLHLLDLRRVAAPAMRQLADATGETVHLSVLDGWEVIYIEKIDSPQPIRAYSMVGGRAPAWAVATGKALLAYQPADGLEARTDPLMRYTPATLASLAVLKQDLRKIVRRGYALNRGEWRAGVGGIGVAVFNALDEAVAAVGISGPLERLPMAHIKPLALQVRECAGAISRAMGHPGGVRCLGG